MIERENNMERHKIDVYPEPRENLARYINEPRLVDQSLLQDPVQDLSEEKDRFRIYIPMDLSKRDIIRRLYYVIAKYRIAKEDNETDFSAEVDALISQIEIYDQIWSVRNITKKGNHSDEAKILVQEFVTILENIRDGGAEYFPFHTIKELTKEYLSE